MQQWMWIGCLALALALAGCGGDEEGTTSPEGGGAAAAGAGGDMSTPRGSIEHQVALLKAGDLAAFKACFTPRLQEGITAEAMAKGTAEVGGMSMDDLFAGMTEGEYEGKKTAKVKMKNGRTLTTLILTDGKWLADTIWFK
jgi:hypothetical protein